MEGVDKKRIKINKAQAMIEERLSKKHTARRKTMRTMATQTRKKLTLAPSCSPFSTRLVHLGRK